MTLDPLTSVKIISSIALVVVAVNMAIKLIKRNPRYWLHRFFAIFFIANSAGFLCYIVYHFISDNESLTIGLIITTQILFNISFANLLMTWFIMRSSEKVAMKPQYLISLLGLLGITCIGYFIWIPSVDPAAYAVGIVHSVIPIGWSIFTNMYRIGMLLLVILSYFKWARKAEEDIKRKMMLFIIGMTCVLVGILCIFLAGVAESMEVIFTLAGLAGLLVSLVYLFRALVFRLPEETK